MCLVTGSFRSAWIAGGLFGIGGLGRWRLGAPVATCDREERWENDRGEPRTSRSAINRSAIKRKGGFFETPISFLDWPVVARVRNAAVL
jgi:hypothetical protein